jgi:hypothetical protein
VKEIEGDREELEMKYVECVVNIKLVLSVWSIGNGDDG